ncbi:serine hydrolase [Streptomyces sp. NPDC051976]|uniref:serine hydrolase n=1 Tax=Streptomyces sp. NPDC051976 TaxID=3154947 RepID=UPI003412BE74
MPVSGGLNGVGAWLRERLPGLLAESGVPGAAVAVDVGGEVVEAAAGVLSTATGVEATTDSLFQIGSITKTVTATLVMQLVDEGLLDLDAPARSVLPEFRLADERAAQTVTVRQLLCHTSGFEGDVFTDTGKGDDCLERYVDALGGEAQLFPPGAMFSYNNAGFSVLGRIVEVLRGEPFDVCARTRLFAPLGMDHTACDPYEAVLHRTAVGHVGHKPGGPLEPTGIWALPRSTAPAGSMLAMRPRDLLAFARMHLDDGAGLLSPESVRAMRQHQVAQPDVDLGTGWGLGWELYAGPTASGGSTELIGHDGGTIGQAARLRMVPAHDLALVVLTNGGSTQQVFAEIVNRVLGELAQIEPHSAPVPRPEALVPHASRYVGTYRTPTGETTVGLDDAGRLWLERTPLGVAADLDEPAYRTELVHWRGDSVLPLEPERGAHARMAFIGDDGRGHALFLHTGRAEPRAAQ